MYCHIHSRTFTVEDQPNLGWSSPVPNPMYLWTNGQVKQNLECVCVCVSYIYRA